MLGTHDKKTGKPIARHIPGIYLDSGELATNEKARRSLAEAYPEEMVPLSDLMATKAQLERSAEFPVGPDDRIRAWCRPYGTVTGRNNPSGKVNILAAPKWMRALLMPHRVCPGDP